MPQKHTTTLYFEAHVTVDPVFDASRRRIFEEICSVYGFKAADLFMQKGKIFEPSKLDMFCTGRSVHYDPLSSRMHAMIMALRQADFIIRRYKIENTLLDVKLREVQG